MTSHTKALSENLKSQDKLPRRLFNAELSTNSKQEIFYGAYQQVVDALDVNGIPEHKVKGFIFASPGTCAVLVHRH
jgi:hypothetical protein